MKRKLLLLLSIMIWTIPAFAQDAEFTSEDGTITFVYPESWELTQSDDGIITLNHPENPRQVTLFTPNYFVQDPIFQRSGREEFLFSVALSLNDIPHEAFPFIAVEGTEVIAKEFVTPQGAYQAFLLLLPDGQPIILVAENSEGNFDSELTQTIIQVGESMSARFVPSATGGFQSAQVTPEQPVETEPCFISTENPRTVPVRVGPFADRTAIAFLPENEDFQPFVQAMDVDGVIWYQLDPALAAPGKLIERAWVTADDVTTSGDCQAVDVIRLQVENYFTCPLESTLVSQSTGETVSFMVDPETFVAVPVALGSYEYAVQGECYSEPAQVFRIEGNSIIVHSP